ncbi:hypothetical protein GCM10010384_08370 [Streptomyces djakartensis]|uniref:Uncharacterized protein n=1 Tax=Streptomyces djakartensis TaxID=68193 RepID=A0ABQ2Z6U6_9ACTN|nr:hypothetical protein GCM10010384_08370 [Streptomyces djakartensis]
MSAAAMGTAWKRSSAAIPAHDGLGPTRRPAPGSWHAGEHFDVRPAATEAMGVERTLAHFAPLAHGRPGLG